MDILVAKDSKGKIRSTDFNFWVGKLKLLKASKKKGRVWINNFDTGFDMYFNKEGVAFFEFERDVLESDEEYLSGETSPDF